jgi:hypothetical protein
MRNGPQAAPLLSRLPGGYLPQRRLVLLAHIAKHRYLTSLSARCSCLRTGQPRPDVSGDGKVTHQHLNLNDRDPLVDHPELSREKALGLAETQLRAEMNKPGLPDRMWVAVA